MSLLAAGGNYFLQPNGGPAVELSYNGAPVVAGEFAQYGDWSPIAAAQTASGYEVAWEIHGRRPVSDLVDRQQRQRASIPFMGSGAQVGIVRGQFQR